MTKQFLFSFSLAPARVSSHISTREHRFFFSSFALTYSTFAPHARAEARSRLYACVRSRLDLVAHNVRRGRPVL
ncbi:hypothetical protein M431DRAFT_408978 [Trichoderma harzianum CBS 226.95]|uniref:Uncharacterized protein n=1 Tax=Trichoderma harzianum CBS 226.95 TaxID=983964 RepID=A0A2T4AFC3_TRIHA|nr:hypothetical protein M431DRAFT_408978 [Trichoderma harzianum CBS 226.95]PTB55790.1 hypothetical protein M431DRAFT_408978 [Trichoderma harzianum CBS 226.95]